MDERDEGSGPGAVTVRYFAVLRERRGRDEERVPLAAGDTVGGLYARLFPPVDGARLPVGFAVNRALVGADTPLQAGDEVAFLPPLGGG